MAGRCTASVGVSRLAVHERRQPRAAMIVVNGDREWLRVRVVLLSTRMECSAN